MMLSWPRLSCKQAVKFTPWFPSIFQFLKLRSSVRGKTILEMEEIGLDHGDHLTTDNLCGKEHLPFQISYHRHSRGWKPQPMQPNTPIGLIATMSCFLVNSWQWQRLRVGILVIINQPSLVARKRNADCPLIRLLISFGILFWAESHRESQFTYC